MATGHCKYAVNRAGGHLLSSLFSLLSAIPPEDAERARPWRLHMRAAFFRRNHDPPLKCSFSSRRSTTLSGADGVEKGRSLWWGPLAASCGDLWRSLGVCLLSSLFSLLSSVFSLLLVVVVLRRLDPMSRITHSTLSSACRRGLATPRSHEAGDPLDS